MPDPVSIPGLTNVVDVSPNWESVCAVAATNALWCWGAGYLMGSGVDALNNVPVLVPGMAPVRDVDAGNAHHCAVGVDGVVWCWGHNGGCSLGDGTNIDRLAPVRVLGF